MKQALETTATALNLSPALSGRLWHWHWSVLESVCAHKIRGLGTVSSPLTVSFKKRNAWQRLIWFDLILDLLDSHIQTLSNSLQILSMSTAAFVIKIYLCFHHFCQNLSCRSVIKVPWLWFDVNCNYKLSFQVDTPRCDTVVEGYIGYLDQ